MLEESLCIYKVDICLVVLYLLSSCMFSGCEQTLQSQYATQMTDVFFDFTITVPNNPSPFVEYIVILNRIKILGVIYSNSTITMDDSFPNLTFTGNEATGNISFTLHNIGIERAGQYRLVKSGFKPAIQCATVYILGE